LAAHGMNSRRRDFDVLAVTEQTAKKALRHRAAANIPGTNEKDAFHG
jgi:hypothetical protein